MKTPVQLIEGFQRFRTLYFSDDNAQFHDLVQFGQTPKAMIVACCDSRVDPALVLDCAPGDLFVIRNVANLVPPAEYQGHYHGTSAALEFGIRNLGVQHIIVLGHAQCGGIRALLEGNVSRGESFIAQWMGIADEARLKVEKELAEADYKGRHCACEQHGILISLRNLMSYNFILERVTQGALELHGWYFDMERGEMLGYNEASGQFEVL